LVEKKGLEFAIRAFAKVREKQANMRYDIIGDGPLRPKLEKLIDELGLRGEVVLRGAMDQSAVRETLRTSDIFILASVTASDNDQEGTPVSLLEAQASAVPVLATFHGGIPEIVAHNETGLLAPERNEKALANHLQFLVDHPDVRERMGSHGRNFIADNFSEAQAIKELVTVYSSCSMSGPA
jgi:colanic acid/amylovoran biosynthesis glycosyltransferase